MKVYDPILCMMVEKPDVKKVKDFDGEMFVGLTFASGRTEGYKGTEEEIDKWARALLKKYGEKWVKITKGGRVIKTWLG